MDFSFGMVLHHKRYLDTMDHSDNPVKKPRLDVNFDDWDNEVEGNEDLWGQAELTAEEFDYLEVQASQCLQTANSSDHNVAGHSRSLSLETKKSTDEDARSEVNKKQYALEGQVKILSDSLDKAVRELNKERLNRDQIIAQKLEEFKLKEQDMQKEIDKLQTALHFKEQETKAARSNAQLNSHKARDPSSSQQQQVHSLNKSPNNFLNRFSFKRSPVSFTEAAVQTFGGKADSSEVLHLLSAHGKPKGSEIASRLLCNKKECIPSDTSDTNDNLLLATLPNVAKLNINADINEMWHSYNACLKQHLNFLQSGAQGQNPVLLKKIKPPTSSELQGTVLVTKKRKSAFEEEMEKQHCATITCLKDISELLLFDCPKGDSSAVNSGERVEQTSKMLSETDFMGGYSNPLFVDDEKTDVAQQPPPCLSAVLNLATAESYPGWYYFSQNEMEHALNVLVVWSSQASTSLAPSVHSLPLQSLVAGQHGFKCGILTLKALSNMLQMKSFGPFIHQMGSCLFSSVADLCHAVVKAKDSNEYSDVLNTVEKFLCTAMAGFGAVGIEDDGCPCSSQLAQSFVVLLWRYYQDFKNCSSVAHFCLLRKGVTTLHQLSTHMKNFREKRLPVEDHYMSFVCGVSRLSKKADNPLATVIDNIHDLWDFQDDSIDETEERTSD